MKTGIRTLVCAALLLGVACGAERKNSRGDILPEFEEYRLEAAADGYEVELSYQRIENSEASEALAIIDAANYDHTFEEYATSPRDVELSAQLLLEDYAGEEHGDGLCYRYVMEQVAMLVRDEQVLCYETFVELYTGGAHGGHSLHYECYDIASGQAYDFAYLAEGDWGAAVRELIYQRMMEVCDGVALLDDADEVYIPRSVKLTDRGIVLVYQPYEVAFYDAGIISVELSDEELAAVGAPLLWVAE